MGSEIQKADAARTISKSTDGDTELTTETVTARLDVYRGELPPPAEMEKYKAVDPEIVKTLLRHATNEQENRHALSQKGLDVDATLAKRGQLIAAGLMVGLMGVGWRLIELGHDGLGAASLVTAFLGQIGPMFIRAWSAKQNRSVSKKLPPVAADDKAIAKSTGQKSRKPAPGR